MTRTRGGFRKTSFTVKRETFDWLEGIAESFEDSMRLGDLVDLLADHARANKLEDEIFGPAVPTKFVRKEPGEGESHEDASRRISVESKGRTCEECGAAAPGNTKFCPGCGAKFGAESEEKEAD